MRLIDADAFLKRNEEYADCEFIHPKYQNTLREIVDDEPTIPAPRWHRVEEPPKEGQNVLTMDANEDMEMAVYDGKSFFDSYGFYVTDVLYWMPIKPPKEDMDGERREG